MSTTGDPAARANDALVAAFERYWHERGGEDKATAWEDFANGWVETQAALRGWGPVPKTVRVTYSTAAPRP